MKKITKKAVIVVIVISLLIIVGLMYLQTSYISIGAASTIVLDVVGYAPSRYYYKVDRLGNVQCYSNNNSWDSSESTKEKLRRLDRAKMKEIERIASRIALSNHSYINYIDEYYIEFRGKKYSIDYDTFETIKKIIREN